VSITGHVIDSHPDTSRLLKVLRVAITNELHSSGNVQFITRSTRHSAALVIYLVKAERRALRTLSTFDA